MTSALDFYTPQLDRAQMQIRYEELCRIRDMINTEIAPLKKVAEAAANEAEQYRVISLEKSKAVYEARGGAKWFQLKKEIGILAKCLSNTGVPPTPEVLAAGLEVMKGRK